MLYRALSWLLRRDFFGFLSGSFKAHNTSIRGLRKTQAVLFLLVAFLQLHATETPRIPRILHWIHPENTPISKEEIQSIRSWQRLHPQWQCKLWTNVSCKISKVAICSIPFGLSDVEAVKESILQKEGGVFIHSDLIACKTLDPIIRMKNSFCLENSKDVMGRPPGAWEAFEALLPDAFIMPDQVFTTPNASSPFAQVCFRHFKEFPHLTEELRKTHAAKAEKAFSLLMSFRKISKIKIFSLWVPILTFLNGLLIAHLLFRKRTFIMRQAKKTLDWTSQLYHRTAHVFSNIPISKQWTSGLQWIPFIIAISAWAVHSLFNIPNHTELNEFPRLSVSSDAKLKMTKRDERKLELYSNLFSDHFPLLSTHTDTPSIPHIIHFIWGGGPFPTASIQNILSWMKHHPDWTVQFWTDDPMRQAPVESMQKRLFKEITSPSLESYLEKSENWGEKSDLLRCEILRKEGGVYVDHDVTCFRSFEELHRHLSFYVAMEPLHINPIDGSNVTATNCLIGSVPNHPILSKAIEKSLEQWELSSAMFPSHDQISSLLRVLSRTFRAFDWAVENFACSSGKALILPPAWIFPDHFPTLHTAQLKKMNLLFANHQWKGCWFKELPEISSYETPKGFNTKMKITLKKLTVSFYFSLASFALLSISSLALTLRARYAKKSTQASTNFSQT